MLTRIYSILKRSLETLANLRLLKSIVFVDLCQYAFQALCYILTVYQSLTGTQQYLIWESHGRDSTWPKPPRTIECHPHAFLWCFNLGKRLAFLGNWDNMPGRSYGSLKFHVPLHGCNVNCSTGPFNFVFVACMKVYVVPRKRLELNLHVHVHVYECYPFS